MLGYEYNITGKVIEGNKIGIQLGFPTANIEVNDRNKLVPPTGVYAVKIKIHKSKHEALRSLWNALYWLQTNVGRSVHASS